MKTLLITILFLSGCCFNQRLVPALDRQGIPANEKCLRDVQEAWLSACLSRFGGGSGFCQVTKKREKDVERLCKII